MQTTIQTSRSQLVPELIGGQLLVATVSFETTPDAVTLTGKDASKFDFLIIGGIGQITLRSDAAPDFESALSYEVGVEAAYGAILETVTHIVPIKDLMEVHLGTSGDDTITGNRGEDYFDSGAGDDTLVGGERDDWFVGGAGQDSHAGDDGFDTVDYRHSWQGVAVNLATGAGTGGSAEGDSYDSVERIIGSLNYGDTLIGSDREDKLYGMGGDDTLLGGDDEDYLDGGTGADILDGGAARDTVHYGESAAAVTVDLAAGTGLGGSAEGDTLISIEKLYGSAFGDTFTGGAAGEVFNGMLGDDTILAGGGNDDLIGSAGADHLDGGAGIDTALYTQSASAVTIDLAAGTGSGGEAEGDTLTDIEIIDASEHDDTLLGSAAGDVLLGRGGADTLNGRAGDDVLNGGLGNDLIDGGDGNDTGYGGGGDDTVIGGAGDDILNGDTGNLFINGGFETVAVAQAQTALEVEVEGWDLSQSMTFWQSGHEGKAANDGYIYMQMDARDASENAEAIAQTVTTEAGQTYRLSFAVARQPGADGSTSDIEVVLDGVVIATVTPASAMWETIALDVTPATTSSTFVFREADGQNDGIGALLDSISLMPVGDDTLEGGEGNDRLMGDLGADFFDGGEGRDDARYENSHAAVSVDLEANLGLGGFAEGDTYNSIERVFGSRDFGDTISGTNSGDEQLYGLGGNDFLSGGGGRDHLGGGSGDDNLDGGDGNDTLTGDQGDDTISGGGGDDYVTADQGADFIDGEAGVDTVDYRGSSGVVTVYMDGRTSAGGWAQGDSVNNVERIHGTNLGGDTIHGSNARELIHGWNGDDILNGGGGHDFIGGGNGNDFIDGGDGDDEIMDGDGDDVVFGGAGFDRFYTFDGADAYDGGTGRDIVDYRKSATGVTIDLIGGVGSGDLAQGDTLINIERIYGSATAGDTITGSDSRDWLFGFAGDDVLSAAGGNDYVNGGAGNDLVNGGAGNDALRGGTGDDTLNGDAGNDNFIGEDGADLIDGGDGIDFVSYRASTTGVQIDLIGGVGSGDLAAGDTLAGIERIHGSATAGDTITGSENKDWIYGWGGDDTLNGAGGNDYLNGGDGDDMIDGGAGNDSLRGGDGNDTLNGGDGIDNFVGEDGGDAMNGGDGIDFVSYRASATGVQIDLVGGIGSGGLAQGDSLINIERVHGSDSAGDTITGSGNKDWLYGWGGDDTLAGAGGNDYIDGGTGNDTIDGGDGNDVMRGGSGDDILNGNAGIDNFRGESGADTMDGGDGIDIIDYRASATGVQIDLIGGTGTGDLAQGDTLANFERIHGSATAGDTLTGSDNTDWIYGWGGDDTLFGSGGRDYIYGGDGDDFVFGGAGKDVLDGGAGIDTLDFTAETVSLDINLATGISKGGNADGDRTANFEIVLGGSGDDTLSAGSGVHTLNGGSGNDRLVGGSGTATLDGGSGFDTVDYSASTGGITLAVGGGISGDAAGDTYIGIERFAGSNFNDALFGGQGDDDLEGAGGDDVLVGGAGADSLNGGSGNDTADYSTSGSAITLDLSAPSASLGDAAGDTFISVERFTGTAFDDTFIGSSGADDLSGGDGNDVIEGGGGSDTLRGDAGENTLNGGNGNDTFIGGVGADAMDGSAGTDIASYRASSAGVSLDLDLGGTGGDATGDTFTSIERVFGTDFDDAITGGSADDKLYGYDGADTIIGGDGGDFINGGSGNDSLYGLSGKDTIYAGLGDDIIAGDGADDRLFGQGGADTLYGGYGNDLLNGGSSSDILFGSFGNDTLTGGSGTDSFVFEDTWGADTVTDFSGSAGETLDFSTVAGVTGLSDLTLTDGEAGTEISFGTNTLWLNDVFAADLAQDNFIF